MNMDIADIGLYMCNRLHDTLVDIVNRAVRMSPEHRIRCRDQRIHKAIRADIIVEETYLEVYERYAGRYFVKMHQKWHDEENTNRTFECPVTNFGIHELYNLMREME